MTNTSALTAFFMDELVGRETIYPSGGYPDWRERLIVAQEAEGLSCEEWQARKSILCPEARIWAVAKAKEANSKGRWTDAQYISFKKEMGREAPTKLPPLKRWIDPDRIERCEQHLHNYPNKKDRGRDILSYTYRDGQVIGCSNADHTPHRVDRDLYIDFNRGN